MMRSSHTCRQASLFFKVALSSMLILVSVFSLNGNQSACAQEPDKLIRERFSLWEQGAPDSVDRKDEPEQAKDYWVKNVHDPSVTVFRPPTGQANGTAVVIFPGGGHRMLVYTAEGYDPAEYFVRQGVTAFVIKYRLAREDGSPYKLNVHPRADGRRAMRWVRAHAAHYKIDPNKIGIVGFSAGGEVASEVAYNPFEGTAGAADQIDQISCQPNFQVLIYPGPLGVPDTIPATAPSTFMLVANDDVGASKVVVDLLGKFRSANVPVEVHLYAKGGHAFNMGQRSKLRSISTWKDRLTDWMIDNEYVPHPK